MNRRDLLKVVPGAPVLAAVPAVVPVSDFHCVWCEIRGGTFYVMHNWELSDQQIACLSAPNPTPRHGCPRSPLS